MKTAPPDPYFISLPRKYFLVLAGWSMLIALSLAWSLEQERDETLGMATATAHANIRKDISFRKWVASHGGVYVAPTETTPPNPYLNLPDRDVVTTTGKALTLMNPAYTLREMQNNFGNYYGTRSHITSLNPLNPQNAPDTWERSALKRFEQGSKEVSEIQQIDGKPYLRTLIPFVVEPDCLKCHAHQGYKVGDIRGGIGTDVSLVEYFADEQERNTVAKKTLGLVWLVGLTGLGLLYRREHYLDSERHKADALLHESTKEIEDLYNYAPCGYHSLDKDGFFIRINDTELEWLGYTRDELIGKTRWFDLTTPASQQVFYENFPRFKEQGFIRNLEFELIRKDGTTIIVLLSATAVYDPDGHFVRSRSTIFDISKRKQVEIALLDSESRLRDSILDSPNPIMMHAEDGEVLMLSRAWTTLSGYELKDIPTTKAWADKAYGSRAESLAAYIGDLYALQGVRKEGEYTVKTASGETRLWDFQSQPLRKLPDGRRVVLSLAIDVTEQKHAEQALKESEATFRSIGETLPLAIYVSSGLEQTCEYINPKFVELFGYTIAEVPTAAQWWPKAYQDESYRRQVSDEWQRKVERAIETQSAIEPMEVVVTCKDGSKKDIQWGFITLGKRNYAFGLDLTERKRAEDEIKSLAFYDSLTQLPNRRLLMDRLKQAMASSARSHRKGALLFIDLDDFKTLNDTLGHDIGDLLLKRVAERLESCIREGDTVARLGGDEFVVMLEDLSDKSIEAAAQAEAVGEKILAALNQLYQLDRYEYHNTPSIGVTLFDEREQSRDELLKQADIAMYQAKQGGRNALRFFDPKMQDTINIRSALESDLRRAVGGQEQFRLYYQVQVDSSGRALGAEALLRWQHPERGTVSPLKFIPLAEETGLILPLGHWVLATACRQLQAWAEQPETAHLTLAVNVSAKQFHLSTFVDEVLTLVDYFGIGPAKLKLEITESMLLGNVDDIIIKMAALKIKGISFSMDDFGTGYSSLQYLKLLPLDQLKIDQTFVRDIVVDESDRAIVRTIIAMAQSLGLNVIAEGVETEAQQQLLMDKGCIAYQGYLFGRPMPVDQFEALLKQI